MKKLLLLFILLCITSCYPKEKILQIDYYDTNGNLQHAFLNVIEQSNDDYIVKSQEYYKVETPFYIVGIFEYK